MTTQEKIAAITAAIQDETKAIDVAVIILTRLLPEFDDTLIDELYDSVSAL